MSDKETQDILDAMAGGIEEQMEMRLGSIDPAYAGPPALPRVLFDGEITLSTKTYLYIGDAPGANDRVVMVPFNGTWLINGVVGGSTGIPKGPKMFAKGLPAQIDGITTTPFEAMRLTLPDPGWPYRIVAGGQAYYQVNDDLPATGGVETRWDAVMLLDSTTGVAVSRQGIGRYDAYVQAPMMYSQRDDIYTGSHAVLLTLIRLEGNHPLLWLSAGGTTMTVFQIPVS